jgi:hypothetical protein
MRIRRWYSLVESARKLSTTALMATLWPGSAAQLAWAVVLTLAFAQFQELWRPFLDPQDMQVARLSSLVTVLTFFVALLIKAEVLPATEGTGTLLVILLVTLLAGAALLMGLQAWRLSMDFSVDSGASNKPLDKTDEQSGPGKQQGAHSRWRKSVRVQPEEEHIRLRGLRNRASSASENADIFPEASGTGSGGRALPPADSEGRSSIDPSVDGGAAAPEPEEWGHSKAVANPVLLRHALFDTSEAVINLTDRESKAGSEGQPRSRVYSEDRSSAESCAAGGAAATEPEERGHLEQPAGLPHNLPDKEGPSATSQDDPVDLVSSDATAGSGSSPRARPDGGGQGPGGRGSEPDSGLDSGAGASTPRASLTSPQSPKSAPPGSTARALI